jgi:hypothetical protein
MIFSRVWAMPSRWTFEVPPISEFVQRWTENALVIVDPFCGYSCRGSHRNDLVLGGLDAREYCKLLLQDDLVADVVIFDPPYSNEQVVRSYRSIGRDVTKKDTQLGVLYSESRALLNRLLRVGGVALSFGWNSAGFGKALPIEEILLVCHGGAHHDTICLAQRKGVE